MLAQRLVGVMLLLPLLGMLFVSVRYWIEFGKEERRSTERQGLPYNRSFLILLGIGFFGVWPFWVGGVIFLLLNRYYDSPEKRLVINTRWENSAPNCLTLIMLTQNLHILWA